MARRPKTASVLALGASIALGCVRADRGPTLGPARGALHAIGVTGRVDPTEHGARVVPEVAGEDRTYGVEPNGGVRSIASGVRVLDLPNGGALSADDRFPEPPTATAALPERMGGGFLFVTANVVWRADRWLGPATPIYSSPWPVQRIFVGLDRVYLRAQNGSHQALDPKTGRSLDLGPWPRTSFVGGYAALDGWRAVAITDLRGVVATVDAGATWRSLDLPIDAQTVTAAGDALRVFGPDVTRQAQAFEVRDLQVARVTVRPAAGGERPTAFPLPAAARPFGQRPLLAAIEDGWPLSDGTAVVARDGTLARVRLEDGAIVDLAPDAFALKPAHCHPIPLSGALAGVGPGKLVAPKDDATFGFVCGEPRGRTALYAYDPASARLEEVKRFEAPRAVLSAGNGAVAVRGACTDDGEVAGEAEQEQSYCIGTRDGQWREIRVRHAVGPGKARPVARDAVPALSASEDAGRRIDVHVSFSPDDDVADERVAVLRDGRVAIVSPPHGDLSRARLTILDQGRATTVPIAFPVLPGEVVHALTMGIWLDGMEERRPGVLGGWAEAAGTMLGFEIDLDGTARAGVYIRDAGAPMVSGRYGLGWSASRRGYETTDGGMTWSPIDMPEPLVADEAVRVRACGPIGCTAKGWLRVGWRSPVRPVPAIPPVGITLGYSPPATLTLDCEPTAPAPHTTAEPGTSATVFQLEPWGRRAVLTADTRPFHGTLPPAHHADETSLSVEANEVVDKQGRPGQLARVYAWGPKSEEWANAGRWQARWLWPFGGYGDLRSTQVVTAPFSSAEAARHALSGPSNFGGAGWTFAPGDDPSHALLVQHKGAESAVLELEADRPIVELRRVDGDPFGDVDSAVRVSGHWYVATGQSQGELPAEVVWAVDGAGARELTRVPRAALDGRTAPPRLVRQSAGRAIGLLVDGQPTAARSTLTRWVVPIDLAMGTTGDPEPLGLADWSDRELGLCGGDEPGWVVDAALSAYVRVRADGTEGGLTGPYARVRVTSEHACIERLSGVIEAMTPAGTFASVTAESSSTTRRRSEQGGIPLAVLASSRVRVPLRCSRAAR